MAFSQSSEGQSPDQRAAKNYARLIETVAAARQSSSYYRAHFADIAADLAREDLLLSLPVTRKADLTAIQAAAAPFGGLNGQKPGQFQRLFASPGPIYEPGGPGDWWRMAQALSAAGIGSSDILLNCFSYHLTPAGFMAEGGAFALGAAVIPGGVGNSALQAEVAAHYQATAYTGTPDFLKLILEKADETGLAVPSLKRAVVSGGPLFPALRNWYHERGIITLQAYAAADCGLIAFESLLPDNTPSPGLIIAEDCIVELLDPNDGSVIAPDSTRESAVGEVTITVFHQDFPLIRYATGDLSAYLPGLSACGRTNRMLKGWLGRVDMITKIRGMFVHPSQVQRALADSADIQQYSLVVTEQDGHDHAVLHIKMRDGAAFDEALSTHLAQKLRDFCRVSITPLPAPDLSSEAKVIDDKRQIG